MFAAEIHENVLNTVEVSDMGHCAQSYNTSDSPSCCIWWWSSGSTFCGRHSGTLDGHRQTDQTGHFHYPQRSSVSSSFIKNRQSLEKKRSKTKRLVWERKDELWRRDRAAEPMRPVEDNLIRLREGGLTATSLLTRRQQERVFI